MKSFLLVLGIFFIGLGVLAYFVWPFSGDIENNLESGEERTVMGAETFSCPDGPSVATTFYSDESMEMTLDEGAIRELERVASASGNRYANESSGLEFWEHEREATITADGRTYEGCVASGDRNRYITEEIENGYALSFIPPQGTTVNLERETYYKLLFAGPANEYPALTDGYTITMTLHNKTDDTDFETFVEEERDQMPTAVDAPVSPTEINGREGYTFTYDTELGPEATATYILMGDNTVAQATVSAVGENAQGYRAEINSVLESITLVDASL